MEEVEFEEVVVDDVPEETAHDLHGLGVSHVLAA